MTQIPNNLADRYQGLFDLMSKEYGLILTISQMDEIVNEAEKLIDNSFDSGYSKGYSDATKEAIQEIRENYHPNR